MAQEVKARGNPCGGRIATRYVLAVLGCVGLGIIYGLKVNLHVAIVSMVNHTALHVDVEQGQNLNASVSNVAEQVCGVDNSKNSSSAPLAA
ncbi:unnamed protein product, partial [Callosobruchus maculatus]